MSTTLPQALLNIYIAPKALFDRLQNKKGWSWTAFILILLFSAGSIYWLFSGMSSEWIVDQQIMAMEHKLTAAQIDHARLAIEQNAGHTAIYSFIGIIVMTPLLLAITALYLMLVGNSGQQRPYGNWYAMAVWCNMPAILNALGLILLVLFSSTPDLPLNLPNYLSLNQLIFNLPVDHPWFAWSESFNLMYIWTSALIAVGLKSWSNYSTKKAILLGFAPFVVIMGAWAVFI